MKRLSKAILIVLAVLIALVVAALLGVNLYVQSPGTQARIQEELSRKLGVPLVIANTSLTPWSDLRINGISVPAEQGNFLEATSFSARYRLGALLKKRLAIYDMRAVNPKIVWRENAEGKWVMPGRAKVKPDQPAEKTEAKPEKQSSDFQVEVQGFKLLGGKIEFINKDNVPVATFTDVDMDYTTITAARVEGTLTVGRVVWKKVVVEQVRTPFKYAEGDLALSALEGNFAGGTVRASITAQPNVADIPFAAPIQVEGVDLARLMNETGWGPNQFAGRVSASLDAKGAFRKIAKVTGPGRLTIASGQIRQLDLFRSIGEVLSIPGLSDLQLKESSADFRLSDAKVRIESLQLNSTDLKITAKGPVKFDGKAELDARLLLSERTAKELPKFVRSSLADDTEPGMRALDFRITGMIDKPKTDLLDRVVGDKLNKQFDDLVSGIFGGKKKKEDEKKKDKARDEKKDGDPAITTVAPPAEPQPQPAGGQP